MQPQTKPEPTQKQLIFIHPKIGQRKYLASNQTILLDLRSRLEMTSQLYLFSNYYFQYKGLRVQQTIPLCQITLEREIRIQIVFGVFDYKAAQFHVARSMNCLFNPEFYLFLCKSQNGVENSQVYFEDAGKNFVKDDIENLKPDLTNPLLLASTEIQKKFNLLLSFSLSGFNPAPTSQKLNGDLFYLHARTLQNQDLHITASPTGFYINQSKISCFNPAKSPVYKTTFTSLIDLFKSVSDKFKETLEIFMSEIKVNDAMKYKFYSMEKMRKKKWLDFPEHEHGWNTRKHMIDDHLKDWNQIFQTWGQLNQQHNSSQAQKSARLSETYSQFEQAAHQGAIYIIDGKLAPLNPTDQKKKHIYIFNKIFFSIANETVYDHSLQKGQDATPSSSSINTDLINIQILHNLNIPNLRVLHMVIINYRGYKVIAQCIIPGILSIDQMNCSQYGSIDDGKTVETNPQFDKIMKAVCQKMGIDGNIQVIDGNGEKKVIAGSPDIKGILGSDKRKYILDLLRLSPRDLNYQGPGNETCVIRPELLRNYRKSKPYETFANKLNVNIGTDIKFQKSQNYPAQLNVLKDIAQYLRKTAIDNLIQTLKNYPSSYLTNNEGVTRAFHYWGVNMRYLGQVCTHQSIKDQIQIKLVLEKVIVVRSIKHLLRMAMRQSSIMHLGATIVNILNCIFGRKCHILYMEQGMIETEQAIDKNGQKDTKKKKKKKNKQTNQPTIQLDLSQAINVIKIIPNRFVTMKPNQIWSQVCKIAKARFRYQLPQNILGLEVFKFPFQKLSTLRDVCLVVGLVLQRKNYDIFDNNCIISPSFSDKTLPFNIKNIITIQASVKRMKIQPPNLTQRQRQSQQLISSYQVKQALRLDTALQRENLTISGGLNQAAIKLFTRMGRILYILGQNKSAITQQLKNTSMLQTLHSQDYWLNIQTHINLGLYYIADGDKNKVVYYMTKGIYLMLITFGETSPDLLVSFANLARIYQMNKQYKEAIKCYKTAIKFIQQVHGKYHVKMSFCYTSLATICYEMSDIKSAIQHQTQNVSILLKILPETDTKLQDAQKILKMYKQMLQKTQMQTNMLNLVKAVDMTRRPEDEKQKEGKKKGKKN